MKVWVCDGCGKASVWCEGWGFFYGTVSRCNVDAHGAPSPAVVCSETCEDVYLQNETVAGGSGVTLDSDGDPLRSVDEVS